jgi:hypothetical protein
MEETVLRDTSKKKFARTYLASLNRLNASDESIQTIVDTLNSEDELYAPFKLVYLNWVKAVMEMDDNE